MESNGERADIERQLLEAERGEAAAWLTYDTRQWWFPPLFGLWAGGFVLSQGLLDGSWRSLSLFFTALPLLYIWWDRRRRPVYPDGPMPREMRRSTGLLAALALGIAGLVWATYLGVGPWVGAVVAAACTAVGVELYGRVYEADASRARARLG